MFLTLIRQYLNELIERKIRDLTSPQAFHARKVQGFNGNRIKRLTKIGGKLPVEVFALVADLPTQACNLSHTPPPTARTFLLTRKAFVEMTKFVQEVLQRLRVLFFLTCAERQICVFHTEICPNTLTRRWQRFGFYKVGDDIQPIITARVALYRDTTDIPIKLTVFMKRISDFIISPFTLVPFPKGEGDTIVIQRPACLFERQGFKLMPFLDVRSTAEFLEKTDIRSINASQLLLDRLAWQRLPMWVCRSFQIRHVRTHRSITRIRQPVFIPLTLPLMEILVDLPHIVKQVAKANTIGLIIKGIFVGFHGITHHTFNPCAVGWTDTQSSDCAEHVGPV